MDDAQLELARKVHYAFLPEAYADDQIEATVTARPQNGLDGDYCGIVPLPEDKVALTVCDATGHDFAAALFAAASAYGQGDLGDDALLMTAQRR